MEKFRQVAGWRCQIDPMVGPKPRNAFMADEMGMEAHLLDMGIFVKVLPHGTFLGSEHIIPFANIQSIRLKPAPEMVVDNDSQEVKRKPGRPQGS